VERNIQNLRLQDEITVILHRPGIPENIGSTARVMANLGFGRLILSDPRTDDMETAVKLAVSAFPIIEQALSCPSLIKAISESGARFIVGTTARDRRYWNVTDLPETAPKIVQKALRDGAAIIFGPEDAGLSNEELTFCHQLITIPTGGEFESFNLSHAVAITLFALISTRQPAPTRKLPRAAAGFPETEGMYEHLQDLLTETGFLLRDNPHHMMRAVREFINRAEPSGDDVRMIRGVCRRLLWHLRNGKPGKEG
jgi:tRNA/rRNA methyltransferase